LLERAEIVDRRAAAVFGAPRQRKILLAMIEQERSLSQLATLTETPLSLLHHHVRKFMRLGLANITREERRAGSAIKFYRATARAFFIPADLMGADPGAASSSQLRELLERSLSGAFKGALYSHDGEGPRMRLVRDTGPHLVAMEIWRELRLSEAEARRLADELRGLLHRFESGQPERGRRYLVHAAVAPA
jgi:hypothetical protein